MIPANRSRPPICAADGNHQTCDTVDSGTCFWSVVWMITLLVIGSVVTVNGGLTFISGEVSCDICPACSVTPAPNMSLSHCPSIYYRPECIGTCDRSSDDPSKDCELRWQSAGAFPCESYPPGQRSGPDSGYEHVGNCDKLIDMGAKCCESR